MIHPMSLLDDGNKNLHQEGILLLHTDSMVLKNALNFMIKSLNNSKTNVLAKIVRYWHDKIPAIKNKSSVFIEDVDTKIKFIPLDYFIEYQCNLGKTGSSVFALLIALSIAEAIEQQLLPPGKITNYTGMGDAENLAYTWLTYQPLETEDIFLIDPMGSLQQAGYNMKVNSNPCIFNIANEEDRTKAYAAFKKYDCSGRNQNNILDPYLLSMGLPVNPYFEKRQGLIADYIYCQLNHDNNQSNFAPPTDFFKNFCCPITQQYVQKPVILKLDDSYMLVEATAYFDHSMYMSLRSRGIFFCQVSETYKSSEISNQIILHALSHKGFDLNLHKDSSATMQDFENNLLALETPSLIKWRNNYYLLGQSMQEERALTPLANETLNYKLDYDAIDFQNDKLHISANENSKLYQEIILKQAHFHRGALTDLELNGLLINKVPPHQFMQSGLQAFKHYNKNLKQLQKSQSSAKIKSLNNIIAEFAVKEPYHQYSSFRVNAHFKSTAKPYEEQRILDQESTENTQKENSQTEQISLTLPPQEQHEKLNEPTIRGERKQKEKINTDIVLASKKTRGVIADNDHITGSPENFYNIEHRLKASLHPHDPNQLLVKHIIEIQGEKKPQHYIFLLYDTQTMNRFGFIKDLIIEFVEKALNSKDTFSILVCNQNATVLAKNVSTVEIENYKTAIFRIKDRYLSSDLMSMDDILQYLGKDKAVKIIDPANTNILFMAGSSCYNTAREIKSSQRFIEVLKENCQNTISPAIIPLLFGADEYFPINYEVLQKTAERSGTKFRMLSNRCSYTYSNFYDDMVEAFNQIANCVGAHTRPLEFKIQLKADGKQIEFHEENIGSVLINKTKSWVNVYDIRDFKESQLSLSTSYAFDFPNCEIHLDLKQIGLNMDVISSYAEQEFVQRFYALESASTKNLKSKNRLEKWAAVNNLASEMIDFLSPPHLSLSKQNTSALSNITNLIGGEDIRKAYFLSKAIMDQSNNQIGGYQEYFQAKTIPLPGYNEKTNTISLGKLELKTNPDSYGYYNPIDNSICYDHLILNCNIDYTKLTTPWLIQIGSSYLLQEYKVGKRRDGILFINTQSPLMQTTLNNLMRVLNKIPEKNLETILDAIIQYWQKLIPSKMVSNGQGYYAKNEVFRRDEETEIRYGNIECFIKHRSHLGDDYKGQTFAPLTALSLAEAIKNKLLPPGAVHVFTEMWEARGYCHFQAIYKPENSEKIYVVDPTLAIQDGGKKEASTTINKNKCFFDISNQVANKSNFGHLKLGLPNSPFFSFFDATNVASIPDYIFGLLDPLSNYNNTADEDDPFAKLRCPITLKYMQTPTLAKENGENYHFDDLALAKWADCSDLVRVELLALREKMLICKRTLQYDHKMLAEHEQTLKTLEEIRSNPNWLRNTELTNKHNEAFKKIEIMNAKMKFPNSTDKTDHDKKLAEYEKLDQRAAELTQYKNDTLMNPITGSAIQDSYNAIQARNQLIFLALSRKGYHLNLILDDSSKTRDEFTLKSLHMDIVPALIRWDSNFYIVGKSMQGSIKITQMTENMDYYNNLDFEQPSILVSEKKHLKIYKEIIFKLAHFHINEQITDVEVAMKALKFLQTYDINKAARPGGLIFKQYHLWRLADPDTFRNKLYNFHKEIFDYDQDLNIEGTIIDPATEKEPSHFMHATIKNAAAEAAEKRAYLEKSFAEKSLDDKFLIVLFATEKVAAAENAAKNATAEKVAAEEALNEQIINAHAILQKAQNSPSANATLNEQITNLSETLQTVQHQIAASAELVTKKLAAEKTITEKMIHEKTAAEQAVSEKVLYEKIAIARFILYNTFSAPLGQDSAEKAAAQIINLQKVRSEIVASEKLATEKYANEESKIERFNADRAAIENAVDERIAEINAALQKNHKKGATLASAEARQLADEEVAADKAHIEKFAINITVREKTLYEKIAAQGGAAEKATAEKELYKQISDAYDTLLKALYNKAYAALLKPLISPADFVAKFNSENMLNQQIINAKVALQKALDKKDSAEKLVIEKTVLEQTALEKTTERAAALKGLDEQIAIVSAILENIRDEKAATTEISTEKEIVKSIVINRNALFSPSKNSEDYAVKYCIIQNIKTEMDILNVEFLIKKSHVNSNFFHESQGTKNEVDELKRSAWEKFKNLLDQVNDPSDQLSLIEFTKSLAIFNEHNPSGLNIDNSRTRNSLEILQQELESKKELVLQSR
jgi:hypothetical protein